MKRSPKVPSVRTQLRTARKDSLNIHFESVLHMLAPDLPDPVREYRFDPVRKWLLDFAFPAVKVAVELDGGGNGQAVICHHCGSAVRARKADGSPGAVLRLPAPSHYSAAGHARDNEKRNALVLQGWAVLSYTSTQLDETPLEIAQQVRKLVQERA